MQTCSATATLKRQTNMSVTDVRKSIPSIVSVPSAVIVMIVVLAVYPSVLLASAFFVTAMAEHLLISNVTTHIQSGATNVTAWLKSNANTMMT